MTKFGYFVPLWKFNGNSQMFVELTTLPDECQWGIQRQVTQVKRDGYLY